MKIKEWAGIYLKHRDLARKEIENLLESEEGYTLSTKNGEKQEIVVVEQLRNVEADIIICTNTDKNVEFLIEHWKDFAARKKQLVVFSHPKTNQKWIIRPWSHAQIADPASLEQGLRSMGGAVPSV